MSFHSTPASSSAFRIATAPISIPDTPANRPNGCSPTPMIATSIPIAALPSVDGSERERHDLVAIIVGAERHHDELHLHPLHELLGVVLGEAGLHLHLARQLHVPDCERRVVLPRRPRVRRRRRLEVLGRPRPQPAVTREQVVLHLGGRVAGAGRLPREGDDAAPRALAADQLRLIRRPREQALGHGYLRHDCFPTFSASARALNSSFITLPVALIGSSSTNSTNRGTLKFAISSRDHAMTSAASSGAPSASSTTNAIPTSPRRASGTPITAACET